MLDPYRFSYALLDLAKQAGFSGVRIDLYWRDVETAPGVYKFSVGDPIVSMAADRNLSVLFVLGYGHPAHTTNGGKDAPSTPAAQTAFATFAAATAKHYEEKPVYFQLWNEANLAQYWAPKPNVLHYAALLNSAATTMRQVVPTATLIPTGISGFDFNFYDQMLSLISSGLLTAAAVNPYFSISMDVSGGAIAALKTRARPLNIPLWDTESGYTSTSVNNHIAGDSDTGRNWQAKMVIRKVLAARALGLDVTTIYGLRDKATVTCTESACEEHWDKWEREHNFGLLTTALQKKPAYEAVRYLYAMTRDAQWIGIGQLPYGVVALRFRRGNIDLYIVWHSAKDTAATIQLPPGAILTDLLGHAMADSATLSLKESDGPVYILVP